MAPPPASAFPTDPISPSTISHFRALPWARHLLSSSQWHLIPNWSRTPKPPIAEDLLIGSSLATPSTIPHCLMLHSTNLDTLKILLRVEPGLNGWSNILHGGIVATMMDEYSGCLISLPSHLPGGVESMQPEVRQGWEERSGYGGDGWEMVLTGRLEIDFKRAVETPGDYVLTTRFAGREGRKIYMEGTWEDGEGKTYSKGKSTWIGVKRKTSKI